jgi:hypothetical protein
MPFGALLDLIACHRQFMGWEKPAAEVSIDDAIPF